MAPRASIKNAKEKMGTPAFIGGVLTIGFLAIGGAIFMGTSDDGQINVTAAIQNSNQANTDAGGDASGNVEAIPETFKNMPNGGLVSQGEQPQPPVAEQVPEESVSETGTTTVESEATTTVETAQEEGENVTSVE